MSEQNENNPEDPPASDGDSSRGSLATPTPALSRQTSTTNVILFLDHNQDARSIRSTIQRHTARHAAAQRREARLQSSRDVIPRNLEWQRRPGADTPVSSGSNVSTPGATASATPEIIGSTRQDRPNEEAEETDPADDMTKSPSEIPQGHTDTSTGSEDRPVSSPVLRSVSDDEAGLAFCQAYELARRSQSLRAEDPRLWQAREGSLNQVSRGLVILRQRIAIEGENCSDQTIQAVLVVYVYGATFQTPEEAAPHRTALDSMINLRGGLANFGHNPILERQLRLLASGEVEQILQVRDRAHE